MSVNITVDITSLKVNDQLSPQIVGAIQGAIQTSLAIVRDKWQTDIQKRLHSTRSLYLQGLDFNSVIYPLGNDGFAGAVELHGKLPNMLETGFSPFDMKVGFSKSQRIKTGQDGKWYITIPMRHSTPNSYMYGKPMPADVYNAAKALQNMGRLSFPGAGDKSWTGYQHKNKKYDGLTRIVKSYQKATQSQYMTFRRVSEKSDPMSWWHPGWSGVKEAERLMPFAKATFVQILQDNLRAI